MKLVVATNNQGKVKELKKLLEPLGFEPVSLKDEGIEIEVVEDGETFAENARLKAEAVYNIVHCPVNSPAYCHDNPLPLLAILPNYFSNLPVCQ